MSANRLIIIPRWAGWPDSDWYPWLTRTLEADPRSGFDEIIVGNMPNPNSPTIDGWVGETLRLLGDDAETMARTVLIGHSVGCQAILRSLVQLPPGVSVYGTLIVAGWFAVDSEWDAIRPWVTPIEGIEQVKNVAGRVAVLLSDNDPFTADWQQNSQAWTDQIGGSMTVVEGAQHFNGPEYPVIIETLQDQILIP